MRDRVTGRVTIEFNSDLLEHPEPRSSPTGEEFVATLIVVFGAVPAVMFVILWALRII